MSDLSDEKLAELIAIYDEDAELVAFLRELQRHRASALPAVGDAERAKNAIRDEVGSQLCSWINGRRLCGEQMEEPGICMCELAAQAALSAAPSGDGRDGGVNGR
jgi:hypothetical protein